MSTDRNQTIFKLTLFLGSGLLFFSLLVWRLADLQVLRGNFYRQLAEANRLFTERKPVERGVLLDRYGDPLVYNQPKYFELLNPEALYSSKEPISQEAALYRMATSSGVIQYDLDRLYRYPKSLAHITGYIGEASLEELEKDNRLRIGDLTGKLGLEKRYDEILRGAAEAKIYEVNALGQRQRQVAERAGQTGIDIKTTIDPYISEVALRAMDGQRGAVVVMDADTGEVLSLVSSPTFDASILSTSYLDEEAERQRRQEVMDFFTHPQKLFFNRAVSGAYPPGSVFKLITALAGLDSGAIDAGKTVVDEGVLKVGEYSYANWYYTQYGGVEGAISLQRAIARSNDIFFYKAAEWTGPTSVAQMSRLFGLGKQTGIELGSEISGLVPDPAWKELELGEKWFLGNTYHLGIGQGNLLVSPVQMAQVIQAMAKKGTLCPPTLVDYDPLLSENDQRHCSEIGLNSEHVELVLKGMLDACTSGGTGFPFFMYNEQKRRPDKSAQEEIQNGAVACKTGTSEFGGADSRGYRNTHGWFVAITGIQTEKLKAEAASLNLGRQPGNTDTSPAEDEAVGELMDQVTLEQPKAAPGDSSLSRDLRELRGEWLAQVAEHGFLRELVLVALVESDEANPYKEGSRDAAPVVKKILDWINGEVADAPADGVGD